MRRFHLVGKSGRLDERKNLSPDTEANIEDGDERHFNHV